MRTKRELGLFSTIMVGLSGTIGFEVFVLMDYAYYQLSGPKIVLALLLAGLINLQIMFSYAELTAAMPYVGGEYTYIKTAYGGIVSFLSGCFRWLASIFVAALAALSFTYQLAYLFSFISPPLQAFILSQVPLIAALVILTFTALEIRGRKGVGSILVIAFLVIFAIFIGVGLLSGLAPLNILPENLLEDVPRTFVATGYIFPMFFGMRALAASAPLVRDPGKNVPRAILLSSLVVIPLYISLAYVAAGVVPVEAVSESSPFLHLAAQKIMGPVGGLLISVAAMVASASGLSTSLAVQSSIARGMSRDGYLPKNLLSRHSRFGTPYVALITGAFFAILLSAIGVVAFLGYAGSFASLLVFAFVNLSLLRLRKDRPHMERPFKTPLYPLTPISGLLMSVVLLVFPILLGDVYAVDALTSGVGLTTLVLMTYYFRMVGRHRLQVAVGGVNLGTGISVALMLCLVETGSVSLVLSPLHIWVLMFASVVSILAGLLNITIPASKLF